MCLDMIGIADNVRSSIGTSVKKWKLHLPSNGSDLCEIDVKRGICQGDSLSPLICVV